MWCCVGSKGVHYSNSTSYSVCVCVCVCVFRPSVCVGVARLSVVVPLLYIVSSYDTMSRHLAADLLLLLSQQPAFKQQVQECDSLPACLRQGTHPTTPPSAPPFIVLNLQYSEKWRPSSSSSHGGCGRGISWGHLLPGGDAPTWGNPLALEHPQVSVLGESQSVITIKKVPMIQSFWAENVLLLWKLL